MDLSTKKEDSEDAKAYKATDTKGKGKAGSKDGDKECTYCKKHYPKSKSHGHLWYECNKLKADKEKAKEKKDKDKGKAKEETAKVASQSKLDDEEETVCRHTSSSYFPKPVHPPCTPWALDTAASSHMTNNLELLVNPVHCCGNIKTADYTRIPIAGKGTVMVQAKLPSGKSSKIVFEDVLYVPGLAGVNLLSWGVINRKGFEMSTEGDNIFIQKGSSTGRIVCWAKREGSDYILQQMEDDSACRLASYRQWHEAFGHVSPTSIKPSCYEDGNLIPPTPKNFECDVCITSKSTK
jgi:hypothetical protein